MPEANDIAWQSLSFSTPILSQLATAPPGVNSDAINPKVLLYVFDPIMENLGGQRMHQAYGWQDPLTLTQGVIKDLQTSSHGIVNYQLAGVQIADLHPYYRDGFQYDDEGADRAWNNRDFSRSNFTFDYARFAKENNIPQRIESGEIDEVWIYAGPLGGMAESVMAGQGAYWINGEAQTEIPSDRVFPIMGFNFERGVGEALHSFGHRIESTMDHSYGRQAPNLDDNWNKFTFQDHYQSGLGGVGNVEWPVNAEATYDYSNPRFVTSNADDWYNYPNFTGVTRSINDREWSPNGEDYQREYLNWWYNHIPHQGGKGTDDYLNNWWRYVTDLEQFKSTNGKLSGTNGIPAVSIANIINNSSISNSIKVVADVRVNGALGRVDLYLDGQYLSSDALAPFTFFSDLNSLSGNHVLVAKAYELQNGTEAISEAVNTSTFTTTLSDEEKNLFLLGKDNINVTGNSVDNVLFGNAGNNILRGLAGHDVLDGQDGADTLLGGAGADQLYGGDGDDQIWGDDGNDTIDAGAGNNSVSGGAGNDLIDGGGGNDSIWGNDGNDTINVGDGNNSVSGEAGADLITSGKGDDRIWGNDGNDTINAGDGNNSVSGEAGDDNITTGSGVDLLYGNEGNDEIDSGFGADYLNGGLGDDRLFSGAGNDLLDGDDNDDILNGSYGNDTLIGGNGRDYLFDQFDSDWLYGGDGDDTLVTYDWGAVDQDRLYGGDGRDHLRVIATTDEGGATLSGGPDGDLFTLSYSGRVPLPGEIVTITDFEIGTDTLQIEIPTIRDFGHLSLLQSGADTIVNSDLGLSIVRLLNVNSSDLGSSSFQF
jgi:Ca2+-binding RTX toxin-like protein